MPLRVPESPFYMLGVVGSLKQQRFLTAVQIRLPEFVESLSRQLWYRGWAEDMDVAKDASLMVVGRRAGLTEEDVLDCLQFSTEDEVKEKLKSTTEEAVREGAYGMPYLLFEKGKDSVEGFFGSDRFELIANRYRFEWKGPVPDPDSFSPLEASPDPNAMFMHLEEFDEITKIARQKEEEGKSKSKDT